MKAPGGAEAPAPAGPTASRQALRQQRRHPALGRRQAKGLRHPLSVDARTARRVDHEHQRRHPAPPEIRVGVAHRADVQTEPRSARGALDRHRTAAWRLTPPPRQRTPQQPPQAAAVRRHHRVQGAVAIEQPVAAAQDLERRRVRLQRAPAAVQLHHADAVVVQQARQSGAERIGRRQRLPDEDEPLDMRQQAFDQPELSGLPAAAAGGVAEGPEVARGVRQIEVHCQAVLPAHAAPCLVVRDRRLQLRFGVELGSMEQLAAGQRPVAGRPFVVRVVDLVVLARQVVAGLAAVVKPGEEEAFFRADPQSTAHGAAGLLDQGAGGEPAGVVESGLVQRRKDALEGVVRVHAASHHPGSARPSSLRRRLRSAGRTASRASSRSSSPSPRRRIANAGR